MDHLHTQNIFYRVSLPSVPNLYKAGGPRSISGRSKEEKIPLKAYQIVTTSLSACKVVRP